MTASITHARSGKIHGRQLVLKECLSEELVNESSGVVGQGRGSFERNKIPVLSCKITIKKQRLWEGMEVYRSDLSREAIATGSLLLPLLWTHCGHQEHASPGLFLSKDLAQQSC